MVLNHKTVCTEEEILRALPEGFQVVVVPFQDKVQIYGTPKMKGHSHEDYLVGCLLAGANVIHDRRARVISK